MAELYASNAVSGTEAVLHRRFQRYKADRFWKMTDTPAFCFPPFCWNVTVLASCERRNDDRWRNWYEEE